MDPSIEKNIPIGDLDKAEVLAALYNNSRIQGMGFLQAVAGEMTVEQAREELARGTDFDYLHGKVMKVDIGGDSFDPWGYDRDNGAGAAKKVIDALRRSSCPMAKEQGIADLNATPDEGYDPNEAISTDEMVDRLKDLEAHMPAQMPQIYQFGTLLAERIDNGGNIVPMGFNMAAELLLYDLQTGVDGFTNKPIESELIHLDPRVYDQFREMIPTIAKAVCPSGFASEVEKVVLKVRDDTA